MPEPSTRVFVGYARNDRHHLERFYIHVADLKRNGVEFFDDRDIEPGYDWERVLFERLDSADIVVFLVTANFVASDFCMHEEFPRAMRRQEVGTCLVLPLKVGTVHLSRDSPLRRVQWRPSGGTPISEHETTAARTRAWAVAAWTLGKMVQGRPELTKGKETQIQTSGDDGVKGLPSVQKPRAPLARRITMISMVAILGAAALVAAQMFSDREKSVAPPQANTPAVDMYIEKPVNNGTVAMLDDVQIRIKGAPDGHVWILVQQTPGATVFPQGACNNPTAERSLCYQAQFGDESDPPGTAFNVTVVIIRPADAQKYKECYKFGFRQGEPPVTPLASSQTITVYRR